jgi:hypothetical protein
MVTTRQPGPAAKLPSAQCAIAAANIRTLRQRNGWTQAHLGQLMGWPAPSTEMEPMREMLDSLVTDGT